MTAGPEINAELKAKEIAGRTQAQARITRKLRRRQWFGSVVLLVLAFVVMGVAPIALVVRLFGLAALPSVQLPTLSGAFAHTTPVVPPTATAPELALPRPAWVARPATVVVDPHNTLAGAQLQPGFPVELLAAQTVNGTRWYQIRWHGPTAATGGQGWLPADALADNDVAGPVVGDITALDPQLAAMVQSLGPTVALAVYYPQAQQLYLSNGDNPYVLGSGARSLVLAALVAGLGPPAAGATPTATATPTTPAATPTPASTAAQRVASGDPTATAAAYQQLGTAAGLDTFANAFALAGITPGAQDWTQTQATPRALVQFYAQLGDQTYSPVAGQLDSAARARVLALLSVAPAAPNALPPELAALLVPPSVGAHAALVVGSGQGSAGWSLNVAGLVTLPSGLTYVEAICIEGATTRVAGAHVLQTAQTQLAATAQQ